MTPQTASPAKPPRPLWPDSPALQGHVLVTPAQARAYGAPAPQTLANLRSLDRKRLATGEAPQGPAWVVVGGRMLYPLHPMEALGVTEGLLQWVARRAVAFGNPQAA